MCVLESTIVVKDKQTYTPNIGDCNMYSQMYSVVAYLTARLPGDHVTRALLRSLIQIPKPTPNTYIYVHTYTFRY